MTKRSKDLWSVYDRRDNVKHENSWMGKDYVDPHEAIDDLQTAWYHYKNGLAILSRRRRRRLSASSAQWWNRLPRLLTHERYWLRLAKILSSKKRNKMTSLERNRRSRINAGYLKHMMVKWQEDYHNGRINLWADGNVLCPPFARNGQNLHRYRWSNKYQIPLDRGLYNVKTQTYNLLANRKPPTTMDFGYHYEDVDPNWGGYEFGWGKNIRPNLIANTDGTALFGTDREWDDFDNLTEVPFLSPLPRRPALRQSSIQVRRTRKRLARRLRFGNVAFRKWSQHLFSIAPKNRSSIAPSKRQFTLWDFPLYGALWGTHPWRDLEGHPYPIAFPHVVRASRLGNMMPYGISIQGGD